MSNMGMNLPTHIVEEGKQWYPRVHGIARRSAQEAGISTSQASGIIAAVSPNLEFEERNEHAVSQLTNLSKSDWEMVERSASQKSPSGQSMKRIGEVTHMLREKAPALVSSYDLSLMRARRILHGEQWRDVLQSPKTFRFAGNIENPYEDTGVTVDFRHHDILVNQMLPAKDADRGISSWRNVTGKPTRYEHMEDITRNAASRASRMDPRIRGILPHEMQAVLWTGGKWIETQGGTRGVGVPRRGQPYTKATGAPLAHHRFWQVD